MGNDDYKIMTGVLAALCVIGLAIYVAVTYRSTTNAQVTQLTWQRKIDIQQYMTVQESDWSVPPGGRETRHYSAYHHSILVQTGSYETCTGKPVICSNHPIFTSIPIYETKYDYDIDRWITVRTPEHHGIGTDATWPDVSDLKEGTALGSERVGTHYSTYTVHFTQDYALDMTEARWRTYQPGQHVTLILNIFKQALDVKEAS